MQRAKKFKNIRGVWTPFVDDGDGGLREVTWACVSPSQEAFLKCPELEVIYTGPKGTGKSEALLMDFFQNVGRGFGSAYSGLLLRPTNPMLDEIKKLAMNLLPRISGGTAQYNIIHSRWDFAGGETLKFSHFGSMDQYSNWHGHSYQWIAWEELTTWSTLACYEFMFGCLRSTHPEVSKILKVRSTTNPWGAGHNAVMSRFRFSGIPPMIGPLIQEPDKSARRAIAANIEENLLLKVSQPNYIANIKESAGSEAKAKAWIYGDWSITSGGIVDDIWYECRDRIELEPFDIPPTWRISRSLDWGSSKPYAVLYFAESDGSPLPLANGKTKPTLRGDLFLIAEIYGSTGKPNEGTRESPATVARKMKRFEEQRGWIIRDSQSVADSSIFDDSAGTSIGAVFAANGVHFEPANKKPGTRRQGAEAVRSRLRAAKPIDGIREALGLFVVSSACPNFIRTVMALTRSETDPDDIDQGGGAVDDHFWDSLRYRMLHDATPKISTRRRQLV